MWNEIAQLSAHRRCAGHVQLNEQIIVVGGYSQRGQKLKTIEAYNTSTDTWAALPPMHHPRGCPAVCANQGFIYVIGGSGQQAGLSSVERFDPTHNTWLEVIYFLYIYIKIELTTYCNGEFSFLSVEFPSSRGKLLNT